jgi:hypothetical protein
MSFGRPNQLAWSRLVEVLNSGQNLESNHRVLYHHEKQLDKVVRRHNSHDRNAMRRLEFNFIKISCVIYKAYSTPSLRETLLVAQGYAEPELNHARNVSQV